MPIFVETYVFNGYLKSEENEEEHGLKMEDAVGDALKLAGYCAYIPEFIQKYENSRHFILLIQSGGSFPFVRDIIGKNVISKIMDTLKSLEYVESVTPGPVRVDTIQYESGPERVYIDTDHYRVNETNGELKYTYTL